MASPTGERRMAHLLSIVLFLSLFAGLAMFLSLLFGRHGSAIRAALIGTWVAADRLAESAFSRIGTCLRASFPAVEQEPLSDDLSRLLLQLSEPDPQGSMIEGSARDSADPSSPNTCGKAAEVS
jgi:hypothetical protein